MAGPRFLGILLALALATAAAAPSANASKVAMEPQSIRKDCVFDPVKLEREITATAPRDTPSRPPTPSLAPRQPVRYDALPEGDRKSHALDEILKAYSEA